MRTNLVVLVVVALALGLTLQMRNTVPPAPGVGDRLAAGNAPGDVANRAAADGHQVGGGHGDGRLPALQEFQDTDIGRCLKGLPAKLGLQDLGPLSDQSLQASINELSETLARAARRLEELKASPNQDLNTQWAVHQKSYTCLKYSCELACLAAGFYWTFEPGSAFKVNRELNEAVSGKCWFIHLSTRSNGSRPVGVVVYVPHVLFPEIAAQRTDQEAFVKLHNLQNR